MNMRDAFTGKIMWETNDFEKNLFNEMKEAHIPKVFSISNSGNSAL